MLSEIENNFVELWVSIRLGRLTRETNTAF